MGERTAFMLDPDEQLRPKGLVKRYVGEICTPSLLSHTTVKSLERLNFINIKDDLELFPISCFDQANPTPIWMVLIIDVTNNKVV